MLCLVCVEIDSLLLHLTALNVKRSDIDRAAVLMKWLFSVCVWMFLLQSPVFVREASPSNLLRVSFQTYCHQAAQVLTYIVLLG